MAIEMKYSSGGAKHGTRVRVRLKNVEPSLLDRVKHKVFVLGAPPKRSIDAAPALGEFSGPLKSSGRTASILGQITRDGIETVGAPKRIRGRRS